MNITFCIPKSLKESEIKPFFDKFGKNELTVEGFLSETQKRKKCTISYNNKEDGVKAYKGLSNTRFNGVFLKLKITKEIKYELGQKSRSRSSSVENESESQPKDFSSLSLKDETNEKQIMIQEPHIPSSENFLMENDESKNQKIETNTNNFDENIKKADDSKKRIDILLDYYRNQSIDLSQTSSLLSFLTKKFELNEFPTKNEITDLIGNNLELIIKTLNDQTHNKSISFGMYEDRSNFEKFLAIIIPRLLLFLNSIKNLKMEKQILAIISISKYIKLLNYIDTIEETDYRFVLMCYVLNISRGFVDEQSLRIILDQKYFRFDLYLHEIENADQEYVEKAIHYLKRVIVPSKLLQSAIIAYIGSKNLMIEEKVEKYIQTFNNFDIIWVTTSIFEGMVAIEKTIILSSVLLLPEVKTRMNLAYLICVMIHEVIHLVYRLDKDNFFSLSGSSALEQLNIDSIDEKTEDNICVDGGYRFSQILFGYHDFEITREEEANIFFDEKKWNTEEPLFKNLKPAKIIEPNPGFSGLLLKYSRARPM